MSKRWLGLLILLLSTFSIRAARAEVAITGPFNVGNAIVGDPTGASATKLIEDNEDPDKTVDLAFGNGCDGEFSFVSATGGTCTATTCTNFPLAGNLQVKYIASTRTSQTCTVTATRSAGGAAYGSFDITGTAIGPHLKPPATVAIGDVRVLGNTTGTGSLVLENDGELGGGNLTITSITPNVGCAFTVGSLPAPIPPGMSANVTVTFNPTMAGNQSCGLTIVTNGTPQGTQTANASGRGTLAVIGVNSPTYGGGTNIVNQNSSATTNISVTNTQVSNQGVLLVMSAVIAPTIGSASWITFAGAQGCTALSQNCTFNTGLGLPLVITGTPASVGIVCTVPANAMGSQSAMVTFTSNTDAGGTSVSLISCIAGRADASVNPAMKMYADTIVNGTSAQQDFILTNTGNIGMTYDLIETDTGDQFTTTNSAGCTSNCPLAAGAMTTISSTFAPTSTGPKTATIRISSNDPDNPNVDIPLSGTGIAPHATTTATSLQFNTIEVGASGTAQMVTITNNGTSPLTISSAALVAPNGNWSISNSIGMQPVAVSDTRTWTFNCIPTTFGTLDATFRVSSNSTPDNATIDIALHCAGSQATLGINDNDHDFGGVIVGQTRDQLFTLTNTGNATISNVNVTLGGAGTGYTILASPFPVASLAPNGTIPFTVHFAPLAGPDGGDRTFTFAGTWGTARNTMTVLTVHGDGLIEGYDATPGTVTFNQRFDTTTTQLVCITNTGDATVTLSAITLQLAVGTVTGEIQINNLVRRACGSGVTGTNIPFPLQTSIVLAKNQEVEAVVQFDPNNRVAMMSATMTIMSDLTTNPMRQVTINGTSTSATLANNPGILVNFGDTDLDAGPQTRDVTIMNTGVATLDLTAFTRSPNPLFTTTTLPSTPQHLAMGEMVTITVTYTPTLERPMNQFDSFTISHDIAGDINAPASQTFTIQGRGVDRHIDVGTAPMFPPTFRNPGTRAPLGMITITNTGDAPLDISAIMVTNDDVWHLLDADAVQIAGGASRNFGVSFTPKVMGAAPQGEVVFMNNDNTSAQTMMARVTLDGMGLDRNVALIGDPIDVGTTAIGLPITLENGLVVASMDSANGFTIREIQIIDDTTEAFSIADGPSGDMIGMSAMKQYDVTFAPTQEGELTAKALLFLDEDPDHTAEVRLTGRAVFVELGGGGGCSTSHGGGAGMVLVLGALLLARRRRRAAAIGAATVVLALLAWPAAAHAQSTNQTFDLDLSLFDPTPSTTNTTLQVQSAAVGGNGEWIAGAMIANATNPLVIRYADEEHMSITRRTMIEIGGAYAFLDRFEAGLRMPLYNQTGDGADVGVASPSGTARGDLVAHVRAQLFKTTGPTELIGGASLAVTFPTASDAQYAGVDKPSGRVLGLLTLTPGAMDKRLTLTVNAGGVIRAKSELQNIRQGSGLAFGGAVSVRAAKGLWLFGEVYGEMLPSSEVPSVMASAGTMTTAEWLGGVTYRPDPRINIGLGAGRGLVSGLGTPDFRAVLAISFTPGHAEEVIPVEPPKPPVVEKDSDGDGIMDKLDACIDDVEDKDGFKDDDGCPDVDNDNDGFMDSMDKCRDEAEDKDGFQDDDGCPDPDNDNDGVLDMADKCPTLAEDKDGAQDDDGCPEKDNDLDGIEDALDKCPDQAETINGNADEDGCPDPGDSAIAVTPSAIELLETIEFKSSELKPTASRVLGQVAATLKAHPEILRVKINVHVNPAGKDAQEKSLTEDRAMAIREWLIKAGIAADRVSGSGMGGTKPLLKGKKSPVNERVEIIILERK